MRINDRDIDAAKEKLLEVVGRYVELEKAGAGEFRGLCPFHTERTPSFTVVPAKGFFHCFGCGVNGDAVDFVKQYEGLTFHEAVKTILGSVNGSAHPAAAANKRESVKVEEPDEWQPVIPAPDDAPPPPNTWHTRRKGQWIELTASKRWRYCDAEGRLIGYTVRFELPDGGKDIIPQIYCRSSVTGEIDWRWRSFPKPRPMYGLEELGHRPTAQVIIVEGEKATDAARARPDLKQFVIVSWPGGGKAIKHVDLSPLDGRRVGQWPDADLKPYPERHPQAGQMMPFAEQTGTVAMLDIHDRIKGRALSVKMIVPPKGMPDGWDLADDPPSPQWNAYEHLKANLADPEAIRAAREGAVEDAPAPAEPAAVAPAAPIQPQPKATPPTPPPADVSYDPEGVERYFTILGHDHDNYFFFQHEQKQVKVYSRGDFSEAGLLALAELDWWEAEFPSEKGGLNRKRAVDWMIRRAHARGIYDPARVRGRGAWLDAGRVIFHFGSHLLVDGERMDVSKIKSRFVYEMDRSLPPLYGFALSDADGAKLIEVAKMFRWTRPASAALLSGWVALAPLCGAMRWRPHIWVTGGPGSGKSTAVNEYVHPLLNGMDIYAQGNSSEAGIRQVLGSDALPVLFDEAEQTNEREQQRMQGVLALIRQASTESAAQTLKGTAGGDAMLFHIRSMFCLSSVQVSMRHQADFERLTVLSLKPKREDKNSVENWRVLKGKLEEIARDDTLGARLVKRCIDLLPVTRQNIRIFSDAAAEKFGTQRDGDQYGTLLAGAWSMTSRDVATPAQAKAMLDEYDWSDYTENSEVEESTRALVALMEAHIRIAGGIALTVAELVRLCIGLKVAGSDMLASVGEGWLQRYGMRVKGDMLLLSNTSNELRKLVADTPFAADLRGQMLRVQGANRHDNKSEKFNGIDSKCIAIPLDRIIAKEERDRLKGGEDQVPF